MAAPKPAPTPAPVPAPAVPTAADLAALGVEIDVNAEPPRLKFKEAKLKDQPASDRKLTLDSGVDLRERFERVPLADVSVSAGPVSDSGFNIVITHALLTPAGEVAKGPDGGFRIKAGQHRHEIAFDAERMGAMSPAEIENALQAQREVAAHKAALFFEGMTKGDQLLGARLSIAAE